MGENRRTRVLIVDAHTMVRSGLAALLISFEDLTLVGSACEGETALRLCRDTNPDVVLMALTDESIGTISAISQSHPNTRVIAMMNLDDEPLLARALEAGAAGYLLKNVSAARLLQAVRGNNAPA